MRLWVRASVCAYVLSMHTLAWKAHRGSEAQGHSEMFFETGLTPVQSRSLCLSRLRAWIASMYHHHACLIGGTDIEGLGFFIGNYLQAKNAKSTSLIKKM